METRPRILFADDDPAIREIVRVLLEDEGYAIDEACDGEEAVAYTNGSHDLIILDVMMPKLSGFEACERIRERYNTPILFLTAKSHEADKVQGLTSGGDDYLVKPFSALEFLARIHAMLRRFKEYGDSQDSDKRIIHLGDLTFNLESKDLYKADMPIELTGMESSLLALLAQDKGRVFTAKEIYETVWDDIYLYHSSNTVMVHIRNLRKKLEDDPQNPVYIKTVWGKGYSFG